MYSERMFSPEIQSIFKSSQLEAVARLQKEGMEVVMAYACGKEELREILEDSNSDGTPYHSIGTTCYMWNLQSDEMVNKTLETLRKILYMSWIPGICL